MSYELSNGDKVFIKEDLKKFIVSQGSLPMPKILPVTDVGTVNEDSRRYVLDGGERAFCLSDLVAVDDVAPVIAKFSSEVIEEVSSRLTNSCVRVLSLTMIV